LFELGYAISDRISGPHFTYVDPRRHRETIAMIENARRLSYLFQRGGFSKDDIMISIPATEEGIWATHHLRKDEIKVNLYLVSGIMHAATCAEAGAAAITIPVGRILDLFERQQYKGCQHLSTHPGIAIILSILAYFRINRVPTRVIGAGFREFAEIGALGGFDAVSISEHHLDRLKWRSEIVSSPNDNSVASTRGRQAKYPTQFLASRTKQFMKGFAPSSRRMAYRILTGALEELKLGMDKIDSAVSTELRRQYSLETLDLQTLYRDITSKKKTTQTPESNPTARSQKEKYSGYMTSKTSRKVEGLFKDEKSSMSEFRDLHRSMMDSDEVF
ncbi:hypothetical protein BDQ12DRAFT_773456, partial [Crucibulum laeve]